VPPPNSPPETPGPQSSPTGGRPEEELALDRWLEEETVAEERAETPTAALYESYRAWCQRNGIEAVSDGEFEVMLREKGFYPCGFGHEGLRLRQEEDSTPAPPAQEGEGPPPNADRVVYCQACRRPRLAIRTAGGWELECGHDPAEADVLYHRSGPCLSCGEVTGAVVDTRQSPVCPECGTEYAVTEEAVEEVRRQSRNWPKVYVAFCSDCFLETNRGRVAVKWDPALGRYRCPRGHDPARLYRLSPGVPNCPLCGTEVDLSRQDSCPTCKARFIREHEEDDRLLETLRRGRPW
jgi:ribosomal protein L37AE/L43A